MYRMSFSYCTYNCRSNSNSFPNTSAAIGMLAGITASASCIGSGLSIFDQFILFTESLLCLRSSYSIQIRTLQIVLWSCSRWSDGTTSWNNVRLLANWTALPVRSGEPSQRRFCMQSVTYYKPSWGILSCSFDCCGTTLAFGHMQGML